MLWAFVVVTFVTLFICSCLMHSAVKSLPASLAGLQELQQKKLPVWSRPPCRDGKVTLPPSILGVGFGHSGSTSLATHMQNSPYLDFGTTKEHNWFCGRQGWDMNWSRFVSEFNVDCSTMRTFDFSPSNHIILHTSHEVRLQCRREFQGMKGVDHIKKLFPPNLHIIFVVRDPVDKANSERYSHSGVMKYRLSVGYLLKKGLGLCYADVIEPFMTHFGKARVTVVDFNELLQNATRTVDGLFDVLDVPRHPASYWRHNKRLHAGRRRLKERIPLEWRQHFHEHELARDCKERLQNMTGHQFAWLGAPDSTSDNTSLDTPHFS